MRCLAPALFILAVALTTGAATATADPEPGTECHAGFCDDHPTINLFPSGSAQQQPTHIDPSTSEAGHA